MALVSSFNSLTKQLLKLSIQTNVIQTREYALRQTKLKYPHWFLKKQRVVHDDFITHDNRQFIQEVVKERLEATAKENNAVNYQDSPLKDEIPNYGEWSPGVKRTGLIARKLGHYPMWTATGQKFTSTLIQIVDNHVVKYTSPEETSFIVRARNKPKKNLGCMLVGAETTDPSFLTKEYCGIFDKSGVLPKKQICRFYVSPQAALPPGTPLYATHFRVGDHIDVRGKTIGRGFQGVMKRWGFKGMPATHGATKTHRRPGNIGGGGEKGRVWPGTKLPGHMGFKWRILRGLEILRIDTRNNVLWVRSTAIPGPVGGMLYLYDTVLTIKKFKTAPPFPTYIPTGEEPEEFISEKIHNFSASTINFPE